MIFKLFACCCGSQIARSKASKTSPLNINTEQSTEKLVPPQTNTTKMSSLPEAKPRVLSLKLIPLAAANAAPHNEISISCQNRVVNDRKYFEAIGLDRKIDVETLSVREGPFLLEKSQTRPKLVPVTPKHRGKKVASLFRVVKQDTTSQRYVEVPEKENSLVNNS